MFSIVHLYITTALYISFVMFIIRISISQSRVEYTVFFLPQSSVQLGLEPGLTLTTVSRTFNSHIHFEKFLAERELVRSWNINLKIQRHLGTFKSIGKRINLFVMCLKKYSTRWHLFSNSALCDHLLLEFHLYVNHSRFLRNYWY